jgi:hypothetical protein
MSSAEPHVTRDHAPADPAPASTIEPRVDGWVVAALLTPVAIPLLRPLGDHSTSLALRMSLLLWMLLTLVGGFELLTYSRALASTRRVARGILGTVLALFLGTVALNLVFGPSVLRLMTQSANYDFCGPHHGPCEPPVLTDHDLYLSMTSFFFETGSRRRGRGPTSDRGLADRRTSSWRCDSPRVALNTSSPSSSRHSNALLRGASSAASAARSTLRAAPP